MISCIVRNEIDARSNLAIVRAHAFRGFQILPVSGT
jgi:hypothetical protein